MGLMDILNGMQNGPRGQQAPASQGGGGMSPITMALLGLLAYKALKGGGLGNILGGQSAPVNPAPGGSRGGLGDVLGGMFGNAGAQQGGLGGVLGGLLGGGAAGGVLSGGLRNLIGDMEQNGHGGAAQSWVGTGPNQSVAPNELGNALGMEDVDAVAQQTGMPRDQVLSTLSEHLPEFVNRLTPDGRLPSDDEASELVST